MEIELIFLLVAGLIAGINKLVVAAKKFREEMVREQARREQEGAFRSDLGEEPETKASVAREAAARALKEHLERLRTPPDQPPPGPRLELEPEPARRRTPRPAPPPAPVVPQHAAMAFSKPVKAPSTHRDDTRSKAVTTTIRRLRKSPQSAREAIVMHEILGPPKALRHVRK